MLKTLNVSGALIEYAMILFDKQGKYLPLLSYQKEKQPENSKLVNLEDERLSETKNTSQVTTMLIVA